MPLTDYAWPTSITAGVTTGEVSDTLAVYTRLKAIVLGWNYRGPVVAPSSAAQALKDVADYVCDGTADQAELNTALATGRPVLALPGTFSISASIAPPATWTGELHGCGWGTVFQAASGLADYVIKFSTSGGNVVGAKLADFKIDANGSVAGAGSGGVYAKGAVRCVLDHLWVLNAYDAAVWFHEISAGVNGHHNITTRCLFEKSTGLAGNAQGLKYQASSENWSLFDEFQGLGGSGTDPWAVYDVTGLNHLVHPTVVGGEGGIRGDADTSQVDSPLFDGVGRTGLHINGGGWTVQGGEWKGGGQSTAGTYSHIVLDGAGGHSIVGGVHSTDATAGRLRSFIRELGANTTNTIIEGKVLTVNGSLGTGKVERNTQLGNRYRGIIGYDDLLFVRKTADESVTSSATLQNDDHLLLAVEPGCTYLVDVFLIYDGATTGDLKVGFTVPAGAAFHWTPGGLATSVSAQSGSVKLSYDTTGSEDLGAIGTGAGNRVVARASGLLIVGSTAGTLQLQWAQGTSDATATTVLQNSWLRAQRVI